MATREPSKKPVPKKKPAATAGYLHGYSRTEQDRLFWQAKLFEEHIFKDVSYPPGSHVLEVGSGVGAQTEILLRRFPDSKVDCLDASKEQIERAKKHLREEIKNGRVTITQGDAMKLPYGENVFDGAFICWLLEHVRDPIGVLKQVRRAMKPNGILHVNETLNSTFFMHPYSAATQQYWFEFNDHQWNMKGDPFVGAKLGNYLEAAGFKEIRTKISFRHCDNRAPKLRAQFIEFWTSLLLNAAPGLLKAKKVDLKLVERMREELMELKENPEAVFVYGWVHATARAL